MTRPSLKAFLESSYERFNRPEYIDPDPLLVVREFSNVRDREIAGLVSACLALGRAPQIVLASRECMGRMKGRPMDFLLDSRPADLRKAFEGFRYRFFSGADIAALLCGLKRLVGVNSSLGSVFSAMVKPGDETVLNALACLVEEIVSAAGAGHPFVKNLLPSPTGGSACKRPLLFLRWMIRADSVDPGGWDGRLAPLLVQPMDTHMAWVASRFGFAPCGVAGGHAAASSPNLRTALEVTRRFRELEPGDPVKYDFCLTRPGIRPDLDRNACFEGEF